MIWYHYTLAKKNKMKKHFNKITSKICFKQLNFILTVLPIVKSKFGISYILTLKVGYACVESIKLERKLLKLKK